VAASVAAVLVAAASAAVFDKSSVYKLLRGDALWCRLSFFMYIISEYVAPLFLYVTITLYQLNQYLYTLSLCIKERQMVGK
jgi:hypothetical protein